MQIRKLLTLIYFLALISLIIYFLRDMLSIPEGTSDIFYYFPIAVFFFGIIRIIYMVIRRK
jgi:hypothetical protein